MTSVKGGVTSARRARDIRSMRVAFGVARRGFRRAVSTAALFLFAFIATQTVAFGDQLKMSDGKLIDVDEAWEDAQGVWYRQGGVVYLLERARVRSIERDKDEKDASVQSAAVYEARSADAQKLTPEKVEAAKSLVIRLKGGAQMEVDEAKETAEGVWYERGNLSVFIERERIESIVRERSEEIVEGDATKKPRRERFWTTGRKNLDSLIKQNGARYGVDPYLIFLVMEKESHFNARALSPAGARGLMQLMPGTAARFGVRNPNDPAQSVMGGARYLRQLLQMFNGRVDLALAGYNAGEGNVRKYGHRVPPYRETRNYVRSISARYLSGN